MSHSNGPKAKTRTTRYKTNLITQYASKTIHTVAQKATGSVVIATTSILTRLRETGFTLKTQCIISTEYHF